MPSPTDDGEILNNKIMLRPLLQSEVNARQRPSTPASPGREESAKAEKESLLLQRPTVAFRAVTESARAHSYILRKQVQKIC